MHTNERLLDDYFDAWNATDVERILTFFSDSTYYEDMALAHSWTGPAEIRGFLEESFETTGNFKIEIFRRRAWDKAGTTYWLITGLYHGPIEAAKGKQMAIKGVSFHEFEDGKISFNIDVWDKANLLEQFGLMPG